MLLCCYYAALTVCWEITNLRYSDETTLIAGTKDDITELIINVKRASEEAGLYLNVKKKR